jgi:stearoyl-CoA desaturase (delta-9 desaturase)
MNELTMVHDALVQWLAHGITDASGWQIVVYALVVTHITIAAVTIYLHRCQAHRALELHPVPAHFFRFWLWITTGQMTKEWVAVHRKHHAKCETVDDPHSPVTHGIKTVLLRGAELYRAEIKNQETLDKYGHQTPTDWIERHVYGPFTWQGVGLMLILNLFLFGAIGISVWALQMAWIPITAAGIINGLAHHSGYRNFEAPDASTNILPWGILIGGEELHNNHHTYPTSAKLSVKKYEFDIGWAYISAMEMVGWAKVRKTPPILRQGDIKAVADKDTLEAIIANRYEVMAKYGRELRAACSAELAKLQAEGARHSEKWQQLKRARTWLHRDRERIPAAFHAEIAGACAASPVLGKLVLMREELRLLWTRSNVSAEQLVHDLQAWCRKAEESGIAELQAFSRGLRAVRA